MPTIGKIYFLYRAGDGWSCHDTTLEEAEQDVRYWLGKSPGIHDMEEILVVTEHAAKSYLWVAAKVAEENAAYEARLRENEERTQYERLKAKFGKK